MVLRLIMNHLLLPEEECQQLSMSCPLWLIVATAVTIGGGVVIATIILLIAAMVVVLLWLHPTKDVAALVNLLKVSFRSLFSEQRSSSSLALLHAEDKRRRLPQTIILIRHGESEANADKALWKKIPDNLMGLTSKGRIQAKQVGERVEDFFVNVHDDNNCDYSRVHLVVSPFERTLQTASCLRPAIEHRIVRTDIESRIREQEMGNTQNDEFLQYRKEQMKVGRFWYRFREGESGADVLDRAKSWWYESVLTVNERVGFEPIDAMVVVTHGLTMRFILMQLFGWSPTTFHSVWNIENCGMYVLNKDLTKPGPSPYVLNKAHGDIPRSSIDVIVKLKTTVEKELALKLEDYLSVPPPRTTQIDIVKQMLASKYPDIIQDPNDITSLLLMPFIVEEDEEEEDNNHDSLPIILGRSGVAESNNIGFATSQLLQQQPNQPHHQRNRSSSERVLQHCQFSFVSSNATDVSFSIVAPAESDDRLCNCAKQKQKSSVEENQITFASSIKLSASKSK